MKRIKYISIITGLLMLVSCSDFLYVEPDEQVSIKEQFSTEEGVLQAFNGMYHYLKEAVSGNYFIYADLVGGNITFAPNKTKYILEIPSTSYYDPIYNFRDEAAESQFAGFYSNVYSVINEANVILEQIDEVDFLPEDRVKQIKAECLAVRAMSHFLLSQLYAQNYSFTADASHNGIAYITRSLEAGADFPARETVFNTYELLKADLDQALAWFADEQALDYGPDYSYFNTITTRALYARIALYMNDWEAALEHSGWVIENSGVNLMEGVDYISEWEKPEEPVSEIILELTAAHDIDYEKGDTTVSKSIATNHYSYTDSANYKYEVASGDLLALYEGADVRGAMFLEEELKTYWYGDTILAPYYFTKKFQDDPGTPIIRLSEMYLIRAEALVRSGGNLGLALQDLNKIKTRAGIDAYTQADGILEEIFLERRRELAFEGHLFFDIARYHYDVERGLDCMSDVCNLSYPSNYYVLPIPESSTILNENMDQNEGY